MSHILPRYTQTPTTPPNPLEIKLAAIEARDHAARQAIHAGTHTSAELASLRGIPCIAKGIGGTSPGTDPLRETIRRHTRRNP